MNLFALPNEYTPVKKVRRTVGICRVCNENFLRSSVTRRALCTKCQFVKVDCLNCSKQFFIARCRWEIGRGKFCSRMCANAENSGRKISRLEEHYKWRGGISKDKLLYARRQRELNRSTYAFYTRSRNYRIKGSVGKHTAKEWEELKKYFDYTCLCCKQQEPFIKLTEDHIIPIIRGGSNNIENIQPLCVSCNSRKHTKTIDYRSVDKTYG